MKIAVYAIAKNEAAFVERFCASASDADMIAIADTGSTDATIERARSAGAVVESIDVSPWRFDVARNKSLAMVPDDFDVCVCVDLDEVLEPGWRQEIERLWTPQTTRMRYFYDWSQGVKYKAEKIHARQGFEWRYPVHEDLFGPVNVWAETDKLLITHYPDHEKSRAGYRPLLKLSFEENPDDPRAAIYYGRDLAQAGHWDDGIAVLAHYLAMPQATWPCERSYAMRLLAQAHGACGRDADAEKWLLRAAGEYLAGREPWCDLAQLYHNQSRWAECYAAATRALAMTWRDHAYCGNPAAWGAWPHDLAAVSAWRLGLFPAARHHAAAAVELQPDDLRLRGNLKFMACEDAA